MSSIIPPKTVKAKYLQCKYFRDKNCIWSLLLLNYFLSSIWINPVSVSICINLYRVKNPNVQQLPRLLLFKISQALIRIRIIWKTMWKLCPWVCFHWTMLHFRNSVLFPGVSHIFSQALGAWIEIAEVILRKGAATLIWWIKRFFF